MTKEAGQLLSDEAVTAAQAVGAAAAVDFEESLVELRNILASADQVEILARTGVQATLAQRPSKRARAVDLQVFHAELLQALCLASPRHPDRAPADFPALASSAMDLVEGLRGGDFARGFRTTRPVMLKLLS